MHERRGTDLRTGPQRRSRTRWARTSRCIMRSRGRSPSAAAQSPGSSFAQLRISPLFPFGECADSLRRDEQAPRQPRHHRPPARSGRAGGRGARYGRRLLCHGASTLRLFLSALWRVLGAGLMGDVVFLRTGLWRLVCAVLGYPRYVSRFARSHCASPKAAADGLAHWIWWPLTAAC